MCSKCARSCLCGRQATAEPAERPAPADAAAAAMGLTLHAGADGGGASFRVWAPHARSAALEVRGGGVLPLARSGDTWAARFAPGAAQCQRRNLMD